MKERYELPIANVIKIDSRSIIYTSGPSDESIEP